MKEAAKTKSPMDKQHEGVDGKIKYENMIRTAQSRHRWRSIADLPRGGGGVTPHDDDITELLKINRLSLPCFTLLLIF